MFYNYIYIDLRKPGQYTYAGINMSFLFEPFYVGKGIQNRYKAHLNNSSLRNTNNIYKNRKLIKLLKHFSKEEILSSVIKCNFSENEKWVLEQEKHLIECIRRNKHNGPLTNLTEGGERELSGSKYDYFVIYDLEQHKEIKFKDVYKSNVNIISLFIENIKLVNNRFCKLEDKEHFLKENNNPYMMYTIYKKDRIFKLFKKDFAEFTKKHKLHSHISKLFNTNLTHINGYFLDKELNDDYYKEYTIYKRNLSITFSKSDINSRYTPDGIHMGRFRDLICDDKRESLYGYFLDKELNDDYYKEYTVYKKDISITFSKSDMNSRYTLDGILLSDLKTLINNEEYMIKGYFLNKELNDDYYKEYTVYKKDISITFSKSDMNSRYTLDGTHMGLFRGLINKRGNSVNAWFLNKELHDEYYTIIILYYNNIKIITYKGEVSKNLKKYDLVKIDIDYLLSGKFKHLKEVYLDEIIHDENYCRKNKILLDALPLKQIQDYTQI